ncbi:nuclear transport factor 2 family protein [Sphingomonas profundi]|uniref:nuclear transport factor 2 family protein n=1 Tax=Alterirhizorhabdus profundi TaxID=2681549 RepID=UPI0012E97458|nr:nuclear transport factor 2 family protein [Sphingomonas profundi]
MTATRTARQVVDDAYEALFARDDLDGFLADFDDASELVEATSLPYGGTFRGKAAIKAAIQNVFGYWRDFAYTIDAIADGEEYVIAYGRFSATATTTGTRIDIPLAEVWRIRSGKVALCSPLYSDTKLALDALDIRKPE